MTIRYGCADLWTSPDGASTMPHEHLVAKWEDYQALRAAAAELALWCNTAESIEDALEMLGALQRLEALLK